MAFVTVFRTIGVLTTHGHVGRGDLNLIWTTTAPSHGKDDDDVLFKVTIASSLAYPVYTHTH